MNLAVNVKLICATVLIYSFFRGGGAWLLALAALLIITAIFIDWGHS